VDGRAHHSRSAGTRTVVGCASRPPAHLSARASDANAP